MTFMMIIQLLVVLIALWVGARYGSLALGAISGIGLAVLVFAFHLFAHCRGRGGLFRHFRGKRL